MTEVFTNGSKKSCPPEFEEQFRAQLSAHVQMLYPAIRAQLGAWACEEAIADVAQITWESAWNNRDAFDPTKGSFRGWVVTIARRRAVDFVRTQIRERQLQEKAEHEASAIGRSAPGLAVTSGDIADELTSSIVAREQISAILGEVQEVIYNPDSVSRGLSLIMIFDEDVALASKTLGLSADILRRAKRELILCSQVVVKAQQFADDGVQPTLRVLIECLPKDAEAGDWSRQLALACAQAGGLQNVTVEHVMDVTGYSFHTARQYLVQSQHLLRIAATVLSRVTAKNHTQIRRV